MKLHLCILLSCAFCLMAISSLAESLVLTQAVQVLRLPIEEAQKKLPVVLRGVVITGNDLSPGTAVVSDGTAAIYVYGNESFARSLARTNLVEVEGVSDPGEFARRVAITKVRVLGQGQIPPPKHVSFDELLMGQMDSQWVEVEGCLRSCIYLPGALPSRLGGMETELATGGGRLVVEVFDHGVSQNWVDGTLRVRGICFHKFNQKRQFYQMYLVAPEGEPLVLTQSPQPQPTLPTNRVDSLLQFPQAASFVHRVRVSGVLLYQHPGEFLYLYDGERGLFVRTAQDFVAKIGDAIEVFGFPAQGDYSPILEDATFQVVGHLQALPNPTLIKSANDAFEHDAELVSGRAKLIGSLEQENGWVYSLQMDNTVFTALLLRSPGIQSQLKLELGSEVGFTGVCSVVMGSLMPRNPLHAPQSFRVLLRSQDDLRLITPPPWWTPQHILIAATIIVSVLAAAIAIIILLTRTRLQRQQADRRAAETEFAAILKERNRVAREIHDTLAQDLSGISAQLEVARKKLPTGSEAAQIHLDLAHATARNSLQEARRTIWNMRAQVLEGRAVGDVLADLLEHEARAAGINPKSVITGRVRSLPPAVENDVLRIGQEAIHNAIRHGNPKNLSMELTFMEKAVKLSVRDDGCGFDANDTSFSGKTRFGLKGMRERASQNGGHLTVRSSPGQGTEVILEISLI
jgi:signal transduction histidine kinase